MDESPATAKAPGRRGDSRQRLLDAALNLFARNGVNGTSLQMIADEMGVTKAAVYHQFNSKDQIVVAVAAPALTQLDATVTAAERLSTRWEQFDAMLTGLVRLVLENSEFAATLQRDPEMGRLIRADEWFASLTARMDTLLIGASPEPEARVALAIAGGGLMVAGIDPALTGIDHQTISTVLLESARSTLAPHTDARA